MSDLIHFLANSPVGAVLAFLLGLIWGSFFNVLIVRLPHDESIKGRSHCPKCKKQIPWSLNIPLVSYLLLQGKCRFCRKPISFEYPLVELLTGLLFLGTFYYYGITISFLAYTIFLSLLLVISIIDLHHQIIPDELSLSGAALGFVFALLTGDVAWWESIVGMLIGGGIFFSVALLYEKVAKREGLGGGDVKLLGMIGAWLGFECLLPVIIVSSALGSLVGLAVMATQKKDLKTAIPFGPFLAVGAVVYLFFGREILAFLFPDFN